MIRSKNEAFWLGLLLLGVLLPFSQFVPWLVANGLDVPMFLDELFVNRISSFFGWDVIVAAVTLVSLAAVDDVLTVRQRVAVGLGALLGASVGLPLYLWLRERGRSITASREQV